MGGLGSVHAQMEGLTPEMMQGGQISPEMLNMMQKKNREGKPAMFFLTFVADDRETNERLSGDYVTALRQAHHEIQVYFIEDDKALYSIQDGKHLDEILDYLKAQDNIAQIELDSQKLMKPHPKDEVSKTKVDQADSERRAKEERLRKAQRRINKAKAK